MRISVVITTYNRPDALSLVLRALAAQTAGEFEVLIADDGSTPETAEMLARLTPELNFPLRHVLQPDDGFRAPMARNRASAVATGDYIVFLDGDCLPLTDFIFQHRRLAAPVILPENDSAANEIAERKAPRNRLPRGSAAFVVVGSPPGGRNRRS